FIAREGEAPAEPLDSWLGRSLAPISPKRFVGFKVRQPHSALSVLALFFFSWLAMVGCKKASDSQVGENVAKPSTTVVADSILDHVLVIKKTNSPTSMQIAKYYMEKRGVKKVLQIRCPDSAIEAANETLDYAQFQEAVEKPLREFLAKDQKIDYIVLNKGISIRLSEAPVGFGNNTPSLDSYVAALDYFEKSDSLKIVIDEGGFLGKAFVNRFWNATERFSHVKYGGYLVTRLDGYAKR
ncbi:MAG: hypothetical protein NTY15_12920, partial [Planctomycetota bacterium]|nr:hypothetical protein [Planctomycetota bacterium]